MAWLAGWTYRKAIVIDQTDDLGAGVNYQMKLLVGESSGATGEEVDCGGLVASDFDDLRFTSSDGSTLLDYWIESLSGATPNQLATVWIEVPMADDAADVTIYMYYDGTETAVSNGTNTFDFFDDFDDASIDGAKWTVSGSPTESGGVLVTNTATVSGKVSVGYNHAARWRAKSTSNADYSMQGGFYGDADNYLLMWEDDSNVYYACATNGGGAYNHTHSAQTKDTNYHINQILRVSGSAKYYIDANLTEMTTSLPTDNEYIYLGALCTTDWVLVRSYTANEPTWKSFGVQTTSGWANIAKINGIASTSFSKVNGIAVASISKVNGVAV